MKLNGIKSYSCEANSTVKTDTPSTSNVGPGSNCKNHYCKVHYKV